MSIDHSPERAEGMANAGITLVEVLVALLLTSIILLGAYAAVSVGIDVDRRSEDRFVEAQEVRTLSRVFEADIEQLRPAASDDENQVTGDAASFSFVTLERVASSGNKMDQRLVSYIWDEESATFSRTSKPVLVVDEQADDLSEPLGQTTEVEEAVRAGSAEDVYEGVSARFDYFVGTEWIESVDGSSGQAPIAVKLSFARASELGGGQDHIVVAYPRTQ